MPATRIQSPRVGPVLATSVPEAKHFETALYGWPTHSAIFIGPAHYLKLAESSLQALQVIEIHLVGLASLVVVFSGDTVVLLGLEERQVGAKEVTPS